MAIVNKFNINGQKVTLDADIIENISVSANDVSYDDSFQYDENTVGEKLSELEYDVTENNDRVTFASLSELLSDENLSTLIPTSVRHGGMSIRFVNSSDNKYVQYRLMSPSWSTVVANWQGVDDEPTAGSDNLVKSGGVKDVTEEINHYVKKDSIFGEFFVSPNGISENYYWQITDSTTFNKFITKIEWPNPTSSSIDNAFIVLKDNG